MRFSPRISGACAGIDAAVSGCRSWTGPTAASVLLLTFFVALALPASATTQPSNMSVVIPIGTNNPAGAGAFSCTLSGTGSSCTGSLASTVSVDDIELTGITFDGVTFDGTFGEIIPGLASVFIDGGGGTNVNAEWGDADDGADGDVDPFAKAGFPIPPNVQETENIDIINATLRVVFRTLNLVEGVDGEDENFRLRLDFERGVMDDSPGSVDAVPEIIVFERGLNSDVALTLLLADGGESDELFVAREDFRDTGIDLDTLEIGGGQPLGVVGIDLDEFAGTGFDPASDVVVGVRFGSAGNGADIFGVYGTTKNPIELSDKGDAPDSFGTLRASNGPEHLLSNDLCFGFPPDQEPDGQPSPDADGDGADEDGSLLLPSGSFGPGDVFTVEALVTNLTGADALACGWIDFNGNGTFENADTVSGSTNAERTCTPVPAGANSTGETPDTVALDFIVPEDFGPPLNPAGHHARFRIASDWSDASAATPLGPAGNGEVEDTLISSSTLPVSIASFASRDVAGGLEVVWQTVSETRNAGYQLWGERRDGSGQGIELLADTIAAVDGDPTTPRRYRHVIEGLDSRDLRDLAVVAVDYSGKQEVYGLFEPGRAYGRDAMPGALDWRSIGRQVDQRRARHETAGRSPRLAFGYSNAGSAAVDVRVDQPGVQELRFEDLAAAGLDLTGIAPETIAVSVNGRAVARDVVLADAASGRGAASSLTATRGMSPAAGFGPGGVIRFWGEAPALPEALYVDQLVYRVAVDPDQARPVEIVSRKGAPGAADYLHWVREDRDLAYSFGVALDDPWYAARLRADRNNEYVTTLDVDPALVRGTPAVLQVVLAGLTDFPESPDHHVVVEVNGRVVEERMFDGQAVERLEIDLPPGSIEPGGNEVRIIAPGGTAAAFDLFVVDTLALGYRRAPMAGNDRLLLEGIDGQGVAAQGFSDGDMLAYARRNDALVRLATTTFSRGSVQVPALAGTSADYWLSTRAAVHRPEVLGGVDLPDPLAGIERADLLVIAHPAFLPVDADEPHPLNDYLAHRRAEGWEPAVFDITSLQAYYTGGMPLPGAVTRFLQAADKRLEYEHVLLVGGDSYDYTDNLGLGSISFIPTRYAATQFIPHTPSDNLLGDLDGDGVSDKALGRWPVRTFGDLQAIVTKTLDWDGQMRGSQAAVWVTDSQDPRQPSFVAQAERMLEPLIGQQWPGGAVERVYWEDVIPRPGLSLADSARAELFEALEQGRAITGFVGHGAPSMWTFQGLLKPDDLAGLDNVGKPTLITTMTCYTSYFVSPHNDTVAHRWMNGFRLDSAGQPIPGAANGAVAVHGAATLSDYGDNERVARDVLNAQLDGKTLGQAVQRARQRARALGFDDQVVNWTLLGDPTLKM